MTTPQAKNPDITYFEDLKLGQKFRSGTQKVTLEEIKKFAGEFDPQYIHLDEEAAKNSIFGQLVGSGWQTLCLTIRLMVEAKPLGETPLIGLHVDDIRFHRPLLPGATLQAEAEVIELRPSSKPGRGYVRVQVTTFADGEPAITQKWNMLVPSRNT